MDLRVNSDGQLSPSVRQNTTPAFGELVIGGGTAFASGSNPSDEVIDGTGVTAGASSFGTTVSATDGTITVNRPGIYDIELNLEDFSSGTASGNVQFSVQKNAAALTVRMQAIRVAATAKAGLSIKKRQVLAKGDVIRAVVTSAAGAVQTITEGRLSVVQVADLTSDKTA
jgi:hypothetical protein